MPLILAFLLGCLLSIGAALDEFPLAALLSLIIAGTYAWSRWVDWVAYLRTEELRRDGLLDREDR